VDVVVTDGFTGNILVKSLEAALADRLDVPPGALVVGVRGTVVVAHGAAVDTEIAAAISTAAQVVGNRWLEEVGSGIG
jgi:glycerol-3-phosphate acyltransferase PlsX